MKREGKSNYFNMLLIIFLYTTAASAFAHCCPGPCCAKDSIVFQKYVQTKIIDEENIVNTKQIENWNAISNDITDSRVVFNNSLRNKIIAFRKFDENSNKLCTSDATENNIWYQKQEKI